MRIMTQAGPIYTAISQKLTQNFAPIKLEIIDQSHLHRGHAAMKGLNPTETHFKVTIVSEIFTGNSLVKRHQLVYKTLDQELKNGLHALSISAKTPAEFHV